MSHENELLKNITTKNDIVKMWIMEKKGIPQGLSPNDVRRALFELKKEGKLDYRFENYKRILVFHE